MHSVRMNREKFALMAILVCLMLCTAYAFSIWGFLKIWLGKIGMHSVYQADAQLRMVQAIMVILVIVGLLLYRRTGASLSGPIRWACFFAISVAVGHLVADLILRLSM